MNEFIWIILVILSILLILLGSRAMLKIHRAGSKYTTSQFTLAYLSHLLGVIFPLLQIIPIYMARGE